MHDCLVRTCGVHLALPVVHLADEVVCCCGCCTLPPSLQHLCNPPQPPSNTRSLGKRDAVAFVRAVRRYGLQSRLADIAAEVGGAVEGESHGAQQLLWQSLVDGCSKALARAAEQDKQQGQLHDPRVRTEKWEGRRGISVAQWFACLSVVMLLGFKHTQRHPGRCNRSQFNRHSPA